MSPYSLVAAPDLLKSLGKVAPPLNNLSGSPGIGWAADDFSSRWKLINQTGKAAEIDVTLIFNGNNLGVIRRAALAGLGLARLPLPMCEADLQEGRLVRPLANWSPPSVTIYALYSSRHALTLAGKLFISGLARHPGAPKENPGGEANCRGPHADGSCICMLGYFGAPSESAHGGASSARPVLTICRATSHRAS
jgi:DNA-binding transcriptional LysR family regulator